MKLVIYRFIFHASNICRHVHIFSIYFLPYEKKKNYDTPCNTIHDTKIEKRYMIRFMS